ncbi:hypothetical protein MTO96_038672, partial [Rhipicephalus appendiculatus]
MGIPGFFSWISKKYPSIVVRCVEEKPTIVDGEMVPVDTTKLNPNYVEFDCLYIDMNSIVHMCSHPEKRQVVALEEVVLLLWTGPPIADFYPLGFKIDLNGHKHDWQGVPLLPFVDQARLLDTMKTVYPLLNSEQANRNAVGDDELYVREGHPAYDAFAKAYKDSADYNE